MTANGQRIPALKPYMEEVEEITLSMTPAQLRAVIKALAIEVRPPERLGFLDRLGRGGVAVGSEEGLVSSREILTRIAALRAEIQERRTAIEEGTFWEEYGDYGSYDTYRGYYDNEEPDAVSEEQREELRTLFAEADDLFVSGYLDPACGAYGSLLGMFGSGAIGELDPEEDRYEEDDEDEWEYEEDPAEAFDLWLDGSLVEINWRETRARYCRCVYETSAPEGLVGAMCGALEVSVPVFGSVFNPSEIAYPSLADVEQAMPGEMPGWRSFLTELRESLSGDDRPRSQVLWCEAVHRLSGIEGLAEAVRENPRPLAYLYWLDHLVRKGAWREIPPVARAGLEVTPQGSLRAQTASILTSAGGELRDPNLVLLGRRECFRSVPTASHLGALLEEAGRQSVREAELEDVLSFLRGKEKLADLMVTALLMGGRLEEASERVKGERALGWSWEARSTALYFSSLLNVLAGETTSRAPTVRSLLARYAGAGFSYGGFVDAGERSPDDPAVTELLEGCRRVSVTADRARRWWDFAEEVGGRRIDAIVSALHRRSYGRAAEVLVALMEAHTINGRPERARTLLELYRDTRYRRHSAFRKEVDAVLRGSSPLAHLARSR